MICDKLNEKPLNFSLVSRKLSERKRKVSGTTHAFLSVNVTSSSTLEAMLPNFDDANLPREIHVLAGLWPLQALSAQKLNTAKSGGPGAEHMLTAVKETNLF